MTSRQREAAYRRRVRSQRLTTRIGRALGRKRRHLLDRMLLVIVVRGARQATQATDPDFMRDAIVDADIGFTPEELASYSQHGEESR